MDNNLFVCVNLQDDISIEDNGDQLNLCQKNQKPLKFDKSNAALTHLIHNLYSCTYSLEAHIESVCTATLVSKAEAYYIFAQLEQLSIIQYSLMEGQTKLISIIRTNLGLTKLRPIDHSKSYLVSRFTTIRRFGHAWLVECPLGTGQILIYDPSLIQFLAQLSNPYSIIEDATHTPSINLSRSSYFLNFLLSINAAYECDHEGKIQEDRISSLTKWEHHDLLFHYHSRANSRDPHYGATFRYKDITPAPPAMKCTNSNYRIPLLKDENGHFVKYNFFDVIERRTSKRSGGQHPLNLEQLGAFFWHVARIKHRNPAEINGYESSIRPVPCGGGMHEIDLYITIYRCSGLKQGFYYYNSYTHELEHLSELTHSLTHLLQDAQQSAHMPSPPDVLITLASRFERMAWKYEKIAYATTLKNAGVLFNQMYLVATAMNLSPCGLGGGNSEIFSNASNTCSYEEGSIAEFSLCSDANH
ncbi:SagB family peptide dehydrogenase [Pseudomonas alloputida]|uniref:SagB family peptide dehydrogenase n=1 Tax=Pseudomonas alloputida TaxID=1940621 RepID=UPI001E4FD673|nr:SagB family peptide dehydrogenase [Pseudomonas alloputida]MCE1058437.1 SagB family peptide dehydrogenase [Pseudomonas alloputida]